MLCAEVAAEGERSSAVGRRSEPFHFMMSSEYDRRDTIIVCTRNGSTPAEIADFTGIPLPTAYAVVKRFKEVEWEEGAGTLARKKHESFFSRRRLDFQSKRDGGEKIQVFSCDQLLPGSACRSG